MAYESDVEIPVKVDKIEPKNVESNTNKESDSRRSRVKILPRYLQASQGSCHDFCKYGKKHNSEPKKEWVPIKKVIKEKRAELRLVEANKKSFNTVVSPTPREHDYQEDSKTTLGKGLLEDVDNPNPKSNQSLLGGQESHKRSSDNKPVSIPKRPPRMRKVSKVATVNEYVPEKTLYVIKSTVENKTHSSLVENGLRRSSSDQISKPKSTLDNKTQIPSSSLTGKGLRRSTSDQVSKPKSTLDNKTQIPSSSRSTRNSLFPSDVKEKQKKIVRSKVDKKVKEVDLKLGGRRSGVVVSESKSKSAQRLSFRRGTILELKAENNNTPRRLKFRRVKHLGENRNGKSEAPLWEFSEFGSSSNSKAIPVKKVIFEKRGNSERLVISRSSPRNTEASVRRLRFRFKRREPNCGDVVCNTNSKERVVLRHQSCLEGKKEIPSLLNNVIEETASKLVESRKSKVKALVGAFETVISLQDTKPSPTAMVISA